MKKLVLVFFISLFIVAGLPILIIYNLGGVYSPHGVDDRVISVYIKERDEVAEMTVGEYLKGVVAAEMPAEFHEEALKAQAVAARSFFLKRSEGYERDGTPDEHKGALVCTDHTHCQAWISETVRKEKWDADKRDEYWKKICRAVDDTRNLIMRYNGETVNALFHSTSSGMTERAEDVWGGSVPYLQSVSSPGDTESPKYDGSAEFTEEEFRRRAEENIDGVKWDGELFGDINRSDAGGIITIKVGGVEIRGSKFRSIYELKSTNAEITEEDGIVKIKTKGYGHGVGMSQYGADYFARQGMDFREILKTYYIGVEISE